MTYIAETTSGETGQAMAAVGGSMRIGAFVGPIVGGFIGKYLGFSYALITAGVVIASGILFIGFLTGAGELSPKAHGNNPFESVGRVFSIYRKVFLTAGTAMIGLAIIRSVRWIIIPLWGDSIGLDAAEIGLMSGVPMGLEMFMFYPVGLIMDRYGRKWVSVPCLGIFSIALGLIPFCTSFASLMTVVLLMGFGNGLGSGIFLTLGADFSPTEGKGEFLGVWRLFGDAGTTTGPFMISGIMEILTLTVATLTASVTGLVGALIMLFLVKESKQKSYSQ
jgi:MFS family permease